MKLEFTKMHGIGNDYIYFNCLDRELDNPSDVAVKMSPRHFSVGGDGIVMICKSDIADAKMRIFNADGSEAKMCGNAIRCVGKYLYDSGITDKTELSIETLSGIKHLSLTVDGGKVSFVSVDMGMAELEGRKIPVDADGIVKNHPLEICGEIYPVTCVSMGNPHAVAFVNDTTSLDLEKIGPFFEHNPLFPDRVNTEFIRVIDRRNLEMRVWERGSGETYACGTGACAAAAAAVLCGFADAGESIKVHLIGGELEIICTEDYHITMKGPAAKVYDGVYEYEN